MFGAYCQARSLRHIRQMGGVILFNRNLTTCQSLQQKRVFRMPILSRKAGEQIVLPDPDVTVIVLRFSGKRVRLGITAPAGISIHRSEIWDRICEPGAASRKTNRDGAVAVASKPSRSEHPNGVEFNIQVVTG